MKIPAPAPNLKQLYDDLAVALNALESAGEKPPGSTHFGDGTCGISGENGCARRIGGDWLGQVDYSDLLHDSDGSHRSVPGAVAATFPTVVKAFEEQMPEHLAQHDRTAKK